MKAISTGCCFASCCTSVTCIRIHLDSAIFRPPSCHRDHALRADRFDMPGPRIYQRHIVPEGGEVRADVAADRASTDEGDGVCSSCRFSPRGYSAASGSSAIAARSHTEVSWNTAPPPGGPGSSLISDDPDTAGRRRWCSTTLRCGCVPLWRNCRSPPNSLRGKTTGSADASPSSALVRSAANRHESRSLRSRRHADRSVAAQSKRSAQTACTSMA